MTELLFHRCFLIQYITMTKNLTLEWCHGGGNLWVQKILDEISFDEEFIGLGYFEDIDFSFRVSKKKFIFAPMAKSFVYENFLALQN